MPKANEHNDASQAAVVFDDVSFFYAADPQGMEAQAEVKEIFRNLSLELPAGVMSVVGENGIGKTSFLLLAGGRVFPQEGQVTMFGRDSADFARALERPELEEERNRLVSFVYQNMEFESAESLGDLMSFVYENGYSSEGASGATPDPNLPALLQKELDLEAFAHKRTQELSKGQLQRGIVALSLLYGSKLVIMDEAVFAMEEPQKDRTLAFSRDFCLSHGMSMYYKAHNLDLTEKYADTMLLFRRHGAPLLGPVSEVCTRENLEDAYRVPMDALYQRDRLYREMLVNLNTGKGGAPQAPATDEGDRS